jgi:hypothetical protein
VAIRHTPLQANFIVLYFFPLRFFLWSFDIRPSRQKIVGKVPCIVTFIYSRCRNLLFRYEISISYVNSENSHAYSVSFFFKRSFSFSRISLLQRATLCRDIFSPIFFPHFSPIFFSFFSCSALPFAERPAPSNAPQVTGGEGGGRVEDGVSITWEEVGRRLRLRQLTSQAVAPVYLDV